VVFHLGGTGYLKKLLGGHMEGAGIQAEFFFLKAQNLPNGDLFF
jgi:hypothetical protein